MIMKIIISLIAFLIIPGMLGNGILLCLDTKYSYKLGYVFGWMIILALFQVIALPTIFFKKSLTFLASVYSVVVCCGCFICIILARKKIKKRFYAIDIVQSLNVYSIISFFLLAMQVLIAIFCVHSDADDAYYMGTALTSLSTDSLYLVAPDTGFLYSIFPWRYVFSTLMIFWAYLSKILFIHPLVIVHTIIPPVFILCSYILWWEIGKYFFKDIEKRWIYFLLLNIFNIFGNTSAYTQSSFLLFRIWQGKALIPNIIIPMILMLLLSINRYYKEQKRWYLVFITVLAGCCCSSMAVPLCTVSVMVGSVVLALFRKKWKLLLNGVYSCIPCFIIGILYLIV